MTHYAWITALGASFTMLWGQIRGFFARLSSFFYVTFDLDGGWVEEDFTRYLYQNFRSSPFGRKRYSATKNYIRPLAVYGTTVYEIPGQAVTFYNGLFPIFVSKKTSDTPPGSSQSPSLTVSFIRGTFDAEEALFKASKYKTEQAKAEAKGRFSVHKLHGVRATQVMPAPNRELQGRSNSASNSSGRLIGWKPEDIGTPQSETPFACLSYGPKVDLFIGRVVGWMRQETEYRTRIVPWTISALLFGRPGTGKSRFICALAQFLGVPVYIFDLATMDNQDFTSSWESARSDVPCIVAFEDADRLFDENQRFHKEMKLTLDCVLNSIQGIQPSNGIILLATANDVDRLPEALGKPREDNPEESTRPGRLNFMLEFKELSAEALNKVASVILRGYPDLIERLVIEGVGETGAQFTKRCTDAMSEILKNSTIERTTEKL